MNKLIFAGLLFAAPALAQNPPVDWRTTAGCGPAKTQFQVSEGEPAQTVMRPSPGKAMIFVVQRPLGTKFTSRVGLDGKWVGASHGGGYLALEVEPGEHHLCVDWQSSQKVRQQMGAAAVVTAEAGMAYYFVDLVLLDVTLTEVDEAEGAWMMSLSEASKWTEKK